MKIYNLTPHAINVYGANKELIQIIPPSGQVARVSVQTVWESEINTIPIYTQETGEVTGLPPVTPFCSYIVSAMVRLAMPNRFDLLSPGELLRGDDGQPIGCVGFISN